MSEALVDHAEPKVTASKSEARYVLSGTDLRKTYRLGRIDVPVLKGASLHVKAGEWVAVLGPSGCGKSTLLHVLGDLDQADPDGGTVAFDGRQLSQMSLAQRNWYRNRRIGFVFQFYHLLPELNIVDNVLLPGYVAASRWPRWSTFVMWTIAALTGVLGMTGGVVGLWLARDAFSWWLLVLRGGLIAVGVMASAGVFAALWAVAFTEVRSLVYRLRPRYRRMRGFAADLLNSFGLGHRLQHRPRELSGGERQRVAIARALMNQPKILLADEPTGNLDEKTGEEILELIAEQHRRGLTIVMVTHDPAIARRADRLVRLHDGRIEETA